MPTQPTSSFRRLLALVALLVPLCIDPVGVDPLAWKREVLALLGLTALLSECLPVLLGRGRLNGFGAAQLLLLGLAAWAALSMRWATVPELGREPAALLLGLLGVVRLWAEVAAADGRVGRWVAAWLVVGLVAVLVDGVAVWVGAEALSVANRKYASVLFRHNNMAAGYASMLVPLAAAWALAAREPGRRLLGWLVAVAVVAYLVVLGSRAGLAASLLGTLVVVALCVARRRVTGGLARYGALALAALVLALSLLPLSPTARGLAKDAFYRAIDVLQAVGLTDLRDAGFRMDVYRSSMAMVSEAPLLGVGAGNFAVDHVRFDPRRVEIPHAHNDALQVLTELGLPGLALFLGLIGALLVGLRRVLVTEGDEQRSLLIAGWTGSLVVFLATGLFEVPFGQGATAAGLAILLGWQCAVDPNRQRLHRPGRLVALVLVLGAAATGVGVAQRLPASWWHARAQRALEAGELERGRKALAALAGLSTGSHLPEMLLGDLAVQSGDLEDALEHFDRARQLWPHSTEVIQRQAEALLGAGRGGEAVALLEQALALRPSDRELHSQLVRMLGRTGRLDEAIDRAEYMVQSDRLASLDLVAVLGRLWLRKAEGSSGTALIQALVASRHFYALLLRDGPADSMHEWNREFSHLTHRLQTLVATPLGWWQAYDDMLRLRGWNDMPDTALWSAMDGSGQPLFPGWEEVAGPPLPRSLR